MIIFNTKTKTDTVHGNQIRGIVGLHPVSSIPVVVLETGMITEESLPLIIAAVLMTKLSKKKTKTMADKGKIFMTQGVQPTRMKSTFVKEALKATVTLIKEDRWSKT
jgi:hypothetical protein